MGRSVRSRWEGRAWEYFLRKHVVFSGFSNISSSLAACCDSCHAHCCSGFWCRGKKKTSEEGRKASEEGRNMKWAILIGALLVDW